MTHVMDCCALCRIGTPAYSGDCSHRYLVTPDNAYPSWMGPCLFSEFDENASDELDEDGNDEKVPCVCSHCVYTNFASREFVQPRVDEE